MSVYAKFAQVGSHLFRYDTRIYLKSQPKSLEDGNCIAAVIGKNPGSAKPTNGLGWQPVDLNGDKMLPFIENRFLEAYAKARVPVPDLAYVQVLNLFYLCDNNLDAALNSYRSLKNPQNCRSESNQYEIAWFVWGGDDAELNSLKRRFLNKSIKHPFFYDKNAGRIACSIPTAQDFAKHTQGLNGSPIVDHLARILCSLLPSA